MSGEVEAAHLGLLVRPKAGNSGDVGLVPVVTGQLAHESPLARGMAVRALRCLLDQEGYRALHSSHVPHEVPHEVDETVLAERG